MAVMGGPTVYPRAAATLRSGSAELSVHREDEEDDGEREVAAISASTPPRIRELATHSFAAVAPSSPLLSPRVKGLRLVTAAASSTAIVLSIEFNGSAVVEGATRLAEDTNTTRGRGGSNDVYASAHSLAAFSAGSQPSPIIDGASSPVRWASLHWSSCPLFTSDTLRWPQRPPPRRRVARSRLSRPAALHVRLALTAARLHRLNRLSLWPTAS